MIAKVKKVILDQDKTCLFFDRLINDDFAVKIVKDNDAFDIILSKRDIEEITEVIHDNDNS